MTWPARPGLYRHVAKDGTVAVSQVAAIDSRLAVVEFIVVGRTEAPARRPRPRWIAASLSDLRQRAEVRRMRALADRGWRHV